MYTQTIDMRKMLQISRQAAKKQAAIVRALGAAARPRRSHNANPSWLAFFTFHLESPRPPWPSSCVANTQHLKKDLTVRNENTATH